MTNSAITPEKVTELLGAAPGPWTTSSSKYISGRYVHEDRPNGRQLRHAADTGEDDAALIAAAPDIAAAYLAEHAARVAAEKERDEALSREYAAIEAQDDAEQAEWRVEAERDALQERIDQTLAVLDKFVPAVDLRERDALRSALTGADQPNPECVCDQGPRAQDFASAQRVYPRDMCPAHR